MVVTTVGAKLQPEPEEEAHSRLGPSASERWLNCLGSVRYTANMPGTESDYAAEGTAAHTLSEWCRETGKHAKTWLGQEIHAQHKRVAVNWEMVHAVQKFVDYVNRLEGDPYFEERVHYTAFVPNGWGTADDIRVGNTTIITDLKYGKGIQVWAKENPQLMLYALGVFQDFGHLYDIENFKMVVHQPRLDHIDEWEISTVDLVTWARDVVVPAAERAMEPDAPFAAGEWCRFCPAKNICPTRNEQMQELYLSDLGDVGDPDEPGTISQEDLGAVMDRISQIRAWCNDMEAHAKSQINKGHAPIGAAGPYKLVEGRSNRKWKNEAEAEKALRGVSRLKVKDIFKKKLISAPDAEKLLGKDHPVFLAHVTKPTGKPVLVPADDPRPDLQVKAEDEFDDLDESE